MSGAPRKGIRVVLIGWGAIATAVARLLAEAETGAVIVAVGVRDVARARARGGLPEGARLLCDPSDENRFSIYEIFAGPDALEAHRQTAHYRTCVQMIDPITTGPRSKQFFQPVLVEQI